MKKTLAMLVALSVVGAASADIAVEFDNLGGLQYNGGGFVTGGVLTQLIWTDAAAPLATVDGAGVLNPGEVLLDDANSPAGFAGFFDNPPALFTDAGINNGTIFLRAFDLDNAGNNTLHGQWVIDTAPLTPGDLLLPGSIYQTNPILGGSEINNAVTVVPEPATLGLMGVAGLGMYLARRKARR